MLKKLINTYKLHLIVMIGSNLAGLINFAFSLFLFKIASEQSFNLYSALASYLVIISTPGDLIKKMSTSFGLSVKIGITKILKTIDRKILVITTLLVIIFLTYFISKTTGSTLVSSALLVCAVVIGLYSALLSGLLQNNQEFVYTSIVAIGQSLMKIGLGIALFLWLGDNGIWVTLYITSMLTALGLQLITKRFNKKNTVEKENISIDKKDLFTNLFLILTLEILLNIDSIIAINNLDTSQAYIYNSLSLVRKTMLFSLLGFTAIILSESRKVEINKIRMLAKNIFITLFIGGVISILFVLFKPLVLDYLKLDTTYTVEYFKFIFSSLLFVIVLMSTTWFTALKSFKIRIGMGLLILAYNIFYYFMFSSISSGITIQIIGIVIILAIQLAIILFRIYPKSSTRLNS